MIKRDYDLVALVQDLRAGSWWFDFTWYIFQSEDLNTYVAAFRPEDVYLLMKSGYLFLAIFDDSGLHFVRHLHGDEN